MAKIEVPDEYIPEGAKLVEAYETPEEIIVTGEPEDDDEVHNCDEMGCSTVSHVMYRFSKRRRQDQPSPEEIEQWLLACPRTLYPTTGEQSQAIHAMLAT